MPALPPAGGEALCRFGLKLLDATDAIGLPHVAAGLRVHAKPDATSVTQADTELEALIHRQMSAGTRLAGVGARGG